MHHPYKEGYDTLPKLNKLSTPIFLHKITEDYLTLKKNSLETQPVFFEHNITEDIYQTICNFILSQVPDLEEPHTFQNLSMQICEDLVIHRVEEDKDWTASLFVCYPSGWCPSKIIGQNFFQTHHEIPMNLKNGDKLMKACMLNGPYERFVWGLSFDGEFNRHPSVDKRKKFDLENPQIFVRVEKQIIYGFPEKKCFLFALQTSFICENEIDKIALVDTLEHMSPAQKLYKGVDNQLINGLKLHWNLGN